MSDGYREAVDNPPAPAPRPWTLRLLYDDKRRVRGMEVVAANGSVVEHRQASGHTPEGFARHYANAWHYVDVVNTVARMGREGDDGDAGAGG